MHSVYICKPKLQKYNSETRSQYICEPKLQTGVRPMYFVYISRQTKPPSHNKTSTQHCKPWRREGETGAGQVAVVQWPGQRLCCTLSRNYLFPGISEHSGLRAFKAYLRDGLVHREGQAGRRVKCVPGRAPRRPAPPPWAGRNGWEEGNSSSACILY